jgi:predicted ribosome quality control (RQC) complex YloA/Tae2 family protein
MNFDSIILSAVAAELNSRIKGGRVDGIHQPSPLDMVLTIRHGGGNHGLLISAEADSPRIHLTSVKRPNPKTPPGFCMLLRKYLAGGRLEGVEQVDFDRILHLKFLAYDGERLTLVVEIMGKHSNIILVSAEGKILGAVKPVGRSKNRYREILPGRQYLSPPPLNKVNPLAVRPEELSQMLHEAFEGGCPDEKRLASWLKDSFTGISPFIARELAKRSEGDTGRLKDEFLALFSGVREGEFLPVIISDDKGRTVGFYAFPSLQYPEENQHERPSICTVADIYFNTALPREELEDAREEFLSRLRREMEGRKRSIDSMKETLQEYQGAERFKEIGELILSQPSLIQPEAESAELTDYYSPEGNTITVSLDPRLNAAENAEAYFKKFRKALSGAESLKEQVLREEGELGLIEKVLKSAESITKTEQIEELRKVLLERGIQTGKQEAAGGKAKPEFEGYRIQKITSGNWEILVGLNGESNDYLLNRVARPNDLWLHVKASPSAHVVIRTNNKPQTVPPQVLHAAAELAARHSESKHSSLVPVDYTLRKYVRKQKGGPPGKALYVNERTLFITP